MHEVGGSGDEGQANRLPSPDDRLWRHPSEMHRAAAAAAAPTPPPVTVQRRPGRYSLGTVVVAGSLGALAMFGALVATGAVGGTPGGTFVVAASTTTAPATVPPRGSVAVRYEDASGSTIGAGLVVDPRGDVVTAAALPTSLAAGATLAVSTAQGGWTEVDLVGNDPVTGLSVLRPPARLARTGQSIAATTAADPALGRPALGQTVHLVRPDGGTTPGVTGTSSATRVTSTNATCAACNPDGSPLVGLLVLTVPGSTPSGHLAVVPGTASVSALVLPRDDNPDDELLYAVPANVAVSVGRRLGANGTIDHGVLDAGVTESGGELVVTDAAESAGLQVGDTVLTVEGQPARRWTDMVAALLERSPGDEVTVAVVRDGRRRTVVTGVSSGPGGAASIASPTTVPVAATVP